MEILAKTEDRDLCVLFSGGKLQLRRRATPLYVVTEVALHVLYDGVELFDEE